MIARLASLDGADIRAAKEVLAFEATRLSHGEAAATEARAASRALFSGGELGAGVPTTTVPLGDLEAGIALVDLLVSAGLAKSKSEARRLVAQGGASVNGDTATEAEERIGVANLRDGAILLRAGKKRYARIIGE